MPQPIAISIGDVNGIGPEVILKAFDRSELFDVVLPIVHGPLSAMRWYAERLGLRSVELRAVRDISEAGTGVLNVLDSGEDFDAAAIGTPTATSGRIAIAAVEAAFATVMRNEAVALVTAPLSKEAIGMAGSPFHGHTDMLAALSGQPDDVIMLLTGSNLRVGLVTVHVPLAAVAAGVTQAAVEKAIRLGHRALRQDFGLADPRIAVLALNPHAGDGGYIGDEERRHIIPAVRAAQSEGLRVDGPFAADGFFSAHNKQLYDLVLAMYHDQGLIPFKMQAMARGVNVSSGLPLVRTSPDHGTAYAIASHGLASAESMKEAVLLARSIARNRTAHTA